MKTKNILFIAKMIIAGLLFYPVLSFAQGCHGGGGGHEMNKVKDNTNAVKYAVHGGNVTQIGKYNVEMVYEPILVHDPLVFYLTNEKGKPVSNQEITGKAEITYSESSKETVLLEPKNSNGFAGDIQNKTKSFICFLTLRINGENVTARFDGGVNLNEKPSTVPDYTCPMHPEVQSRNPGNCPKCGMTLVKI